jgi:hypothetical protein
MRLGVFFATCAIGFATTATVEAQTITGNDVYAACADVGSEAKQGFCIGYIIGAWEGLIYGAGRAFMSLDPSMKVDDLNAMAFQVMQACPPADIENGQTVDVVKNYLSAHPQERHHTIRTIIIDAMGEAFPCQ